MKNKLFNYLLSFIFLLPALGVMAQGGEAVSPNRLSNMLGDYFLIGGALVVLAAFFVLFRLTTMLMQLQKIKLLQEHGMETMEKLDLVNQESWWSRMYKKWTDAVPVEKEKDIMFDHAYDGIRELDNSLPPWWVALFYISIGFAVVYMTYYHFAGIGNSSREQYEIEMEQAEEAVQAYLAKQADMVDESNVVLLTDEEALASGKTIFLESCATCHGNLGEGGVGPNFADNYWIHGGSIKDLFKTIKYGVPEKGMISWKSQLRASDMQKVASFILTLQGTDPPNQKEPQGELYQGEEAGTEKDTTATEAEGAIGMR